MRILLITDSLRPDAASPAFSFIGLDRALKTQGIHATLLAAETSGAETIGYDRTAVDPSHANDPALAVGAHQVVHLFGWGYPLANKALAAIKLQRKPYIISPLGCFDDLHQRPLGRRIRWWFSERRRVSAARFVLAMNEWEQQMLNDAKVHAGTHLLPLALPADEITQLKAAAAPQPLDGGTDVRRLDSLPGAPYLLVLGPIDPASGAVALLKALAELGPDADGWSIVFAGRLERHWQQMLEAAVRRKGGENRVRFINHPDVPTQRQLLAGCGILVAPVLRSRPPIAMMQAAAAGVPACGTKCAAPLGLDCTTCEPDRAALRDMLRGMLRRTDSERRATALRLQEQAKGYLGWSNHVAEFISLYRGISGSA